VPSQRSSVAVPVLGLVSAVVGGVGIVLGALSVITWSELKERGGTGNLIAQVERQLPGYTTIEVGRAWLLVALGALLVVAGFGLIMRARWARWLALGYAAAAVLLHTSYVYYETLEVMPVVRGLAGARPAQDQTAVLAGVVGTALLFIVHAAILVAALLSRAGRAAFVPARPPAAHGGGTRGAYLAHSLRSSVR
jgi:hypothetical protein